MGALEKIEKLPDWPARMTAPVAAAYLCVSQSTFLARFYSIGRKEGGNTFWARAQLDKIVAEQFDLAPNDLVSPTAPPEDEYEAWKARRTKG